jgi:hypothetical protein
MTVVEMVLRTMKTLAKQMIIERANKFYSIAERT